MTESSGICHYLEDMYGSRALGVAKDHRLRRVPKLAVPQRCYAHIPANPGATVHAPRAEERRIPGWLRTYFGHYSLRSVEMALEGKEFLCADKFTMADIAVGYALFLRCFAGIGRAL